MFGKSCRKDSTEVKGTGNVGKCVRQKTAKEIRLMEMCEEWELRRQQRRLDRRKWVEERKRLKNPAWRREGRTRQAQKVSNEKANEQHIPSDTNKTSGKVNIETNVSKNQRARDVTRPLLGDRRTRGVTQSKDRRSIKTDDHVIEEQRCSEEGAQSTQARASFDTRSTRRKLKEKPPIQEPLTETCNERPKPYSVSCTDCQQTSTNAILDNGEGQACGSRSPEGQAARDALQLKITNCYSLNAPAQNDQQVNREVASSITTSLSASSTTLPTSEQTAPSFGVQRTAPLSMDSGYLMPVIKPGSQEVAYAFWPRNMLHNASGAVLPGCYTAPKGSRPIAPKTSTSTSAIDRMTGTSLSAVSERSLQSHVQESPKRGFPPNVTILSNSVIQFKDHVANNLRPVPINVYRSCPDLNAVPVVSGSASTTHAHPPLVVTQTDTKVTSQKPVLNPMSIHVRAKLVPREIMSRASVKSRGKFVKTEMICDKELTKWTAKNVADFIAATDCAENAQAFLEQEIDGKAVLLITQEILMKGMDLKLGPAVKLYSHISNLRSAMTNQPDKPKVLTYTID